MLTSILHNRVSIVFSLCLSSPCRSIGVTHTCGTSLAFRWVLGIPTQVLILVWQALLHTEPLPYFGSSQGSVIVRDPKAP